MELAFFTRGAHGYEPQRYADSGWAPDMLNGAATCGLLAHVLENNHGAPGFEPARLTVDLFRPVRKRPVTVTTTPVRTGNRILVADATLVQDGLDVARATAIFLRKSEQPPGRIWVRPEQPAPPPGELTAQPFTHLWGSDAQGGWTPRLRDHQNDSRHRSWQRPLPVVLGEPPSPFAAAAVIGESTSMMTNWGSAGVGFINTDLTLALARPAEGVAIGIEADNHLGVDGIAVGSATLFDESGPFATCVVTALSNAQRQISFGATTRFDQGG